MNLTFFQVGTGVVNALINAKKTVDKSAADELETLPVVATSVGYGIYMGVSSNLRYVGLQLNYSFMHLSTALCFSFS